MSLVQRAYQCYDKPQSLLRVNINIYGSPLKRSSRSQRKFMPAQTLMCLYIIMHPKSIYMNNFISFYIFYTPKKNMNFISFKK